MIEATGSLVSADVQLDEARQVKARQYARIRRRLWLIDMLISAFYAIAWLVSGWSLSLRTWLTGWISNEWLLVAVFAAIFVGIFSFLTLPLGYYGGYVLPHAFGQSNQTFKGWLVDQVIGVLIGAPLGLILLELLYLALRVSGSWWWLWAAGGLLIFQVLLTNLAPVLLMPLFNKFVPLGEEHANLAERLVELAKKTKTNVRGVYKFDMSRRTKAANGALTGIGNTRRIVLGDTLINEFTPDEIEVILAHELAHHVHHDIPILIGFQALVTTVGLYIASLVMNWLVKVLGLNGVADIAGLPALMLVLGGYSLFSMPIENAFSRWRETKADDFALQLTGKNLAKASALTRAANQNLGEIDPERWVVWLFYDHPPLGERIEKAKNWKPSL